MEIFCEMDEKRTFWRVNCFARACVIFPIFRFVLQKKNREVPIDARGVSFYEFSFDFFSFFFEYEMITVRVCT